MNSFKRGIILLSSIILTSQPVWADMALAGRHRLVSVKPEMSGSIVTVALSIKNVGSSPIYSVDLSAKDPLFPPVDTANVKHIGILSAGEEVSLIWDIPTSLPPDQLYPDMDIPLYIDVETTDDAGNRVALEVSSIREGGIK